MESFRAAFAGSLLGHFIYDRFNGRVMKFKEDYADYAPDEKYFRHVSIVDELDKAKDPSFSESNISLTTVQVTFDGDDDPEHPHNWPIWTKALVGFSTGLLSAFVYISATIVSVGIPLVIEEYSVTETKAALTVSVFIYGYGIGSMIFAPLSEHPMYGRNFFYAFTLFVFAVLQIPLYFVHSFAGLVVLRFFSGIFISPVLATGGASFVDMFVPAYAALAMPFWGVGAFLGVSLGPFFGAVLIQDSGDYRWTFWFLMIWAWALSALFCVIPETYNYSILYRKAQRLRRVTGNKNLTIYPEGTESALSDVKEILWRAVTISFTEPVVILINLYIPMVYAMAYLFLEAFPIVFTETHQFSPIVSQLPYLSIFIGSVIGVVLYCIVIYKPYTLEMLAGKPVHAEVFMPVAIFGSVFMPISLFIFGWTSASELHWFPPVLSGAMFGISALILFQTLLNYIAFSFPRYVASAFAGNSLARAFIAGSFPLFGRRLFLNLHNGRFPVGYGSTVLGCISLVMVLIPVLFYLNGKKLRAHSKFSGF